MARTIFYATEGNLGNVASLLQKCAVAAIRDGSERITVNKIQEFKHSLSTVKARA